MINTLIIEDENLTAIRLEKLLSKLDRSIIVLAKISSIKSAVHWFQNNAMPQLIFMDIQLADGLSFEIFKQVNINTNIIFTTAFDQYAIEAFKVEGLDYLLKPIEETALHQSLSRFYKKQSNAITNLNVQELLKLVQPNTSYKNKFLVNFRDILKPIQVSDIAYFVSEFKTTFIITKANEKFRIDDTLEQVEQQVNPKIFFKITRQLIVNSDAIKEIAQYFNGRLKLKINPEYNQEILVSREKSLQLKEWLNK